MEDSSAPMFKGAFFEREGWVHASEVSFRGEVSGQVRVFRGPS